MLRLRHACLYLSSSRGWAVALSLLAHGSVAVGVAAAAGNWASSPRIDHATLSVEPSSLPRLASEAVPLRPWDHDEGANVGQDLPLDTELPERTEELVPEPIEGEPPPELLVEGRRTPRPLPVLAGSPGSLAALLARNPPRAAEQEPPARAAALEPSVAQLEPTRSAPVPAAAPERNEESTRTRIATRIASRCTTQQTEALAALLRWKGTIQVDLDIDVRGLPTIRQITTQHGKADRRIQDTLALEMARWRFHPAQRGNASVECSLEVVLTF